MRQDGFEAVANIVRKRQFKYILIAEGAVIGLITGVLVSAFRLLLMWADELRGMLAEYTGAGGLVCILVLAAVSIAVSILLRWEPDIAGSGIPQVEAELRGMKDMKWWRVIAAKMAGCALAIGGGLALGREGPSIQLGAMVGKGFARTGHRLLTEERLLVTCGAGAGLSAAFGAPLAGAIFSLEELHRNFSGEVLLTTMAASAAGDFIAANILGLEPVFGFEIEHGLPLRYYWAVIALGLILGLFGFVYNRTIDVMQDVFEKIGKLGGDVFTRMFVIFAASCALFFIYPDVLGSGAGLALSVSRGEFALKALAVLLIVKFVFSTASFGSGAPGGIFLPLLVLGAITGGLICRLLGLAGFDQTYIDAFVVISMAGMFAAIVRAPVTGVVLITEMTGDFTTLLPLVVASLVAYVVAESLGAKPIYTQLMQKSMGKGRNSNRSMLLRDRKTVIDAEVNVGSYMDGRRVSEFGLPIGTLIVSVLRDGSEIIPDGNTILRAGDELEILTREADLADAEDIIDNACGVID